VLLPEGEWRKHNTEKGYSLRKKGMTLDCHKAHERVGWGKIDKCASGWEMGQKAG